MYKSLINITDWSGGMTLNRHKGNANQFTVGYGSDFSSKKGTLSVGHAFEETPQADSNPFTTTEATYMLQTAKDGRGYLFGENTKIYYVSAGVARINEATDSTATGVFKGAMEYKDYLLYAQDTTIGNKALTAAVGSGWDFNYVSANVASVPYHSMYEAPNKTAYICNDVNISSITDPADGDGSSFTEAALILPTGWQARDIDDFGFRYTAVAANHVQGTNESDDCRIFLFDRSGTTWQDEIEIPETKIKAIQWAAGYLWVWAGKGCNIYVIPETSRKAIKIFSFSREDPTIDLEVYPGAVKKRGGTIFFGLNGITTNEAIKDIQSGVYSFPSDPNNFSLNLVYQRASVADEYKGLGILFNTLYVSVDNTDTPAIRIMREMMGATDLHYSVASSAETLEYKAPPGTQMYVEYVGIEFDALPAGCNISCNYTRDSDDTNRVLFSNHTTAGSTEKITKLGRKMNSIQIMPQLKGTITGANYSYRPFVKRIYVTGYLIGKNGPR